MLRLLWIIHLVNFLIQIFSGRFDTSGSMVPRLVPEISSLDAFCDGAGAAGIGDSRSLMDSKKTDFCSNKKIPDAADLKI